MGDQAQELQGETVESVVVAKVRPHLASVLRPRVVANGELFIRPPGKKYGVPGHKPDNNIGLSVFLEARVPNPQNKESPELLKARQADRELVFGVPCSETVCANASFPAEAKPRIGTPDGESGNKGIGDCEDYLTAEIEVLQRRNVALKIAGQPPKDLPYSLKTMLYGYEHFWLPLPLPLPLAP